ncbi:MAG: hypothetical protein K1X29_10840 [Bdellovibrionales bacterium]|nr:hypothetical protein [Bdellovibrionales bacterium]
MKQKILSSRRSLILDPIHPTDYLHLNVTFACEQCSHFAPEEKTCTIGYQAHHHLMNNQVKLYERTGRVAFCRFLEID